MFDHVRNVFAMGDTGSHVTLGRAIGADPANLVGGSASRGESGALDWNEVSGHYGELWTDAIRGQFQSVMKDFGVNIGKGGGFPG